MLRERKKFPYAKTTKIKKTYFSKFGEWLLFPERKHVGTVFS